MFTVAHINGKINGIEMHGLIADTATTINCILGRNWFRQSYGTHISGPSVPNLKEYKTKLNLEFDVLEYKSKHDGPQRRTPMKATFGQFSTVGTHHYGSICIPVYVAEEEAYLPVHNVMHVTARPKQEVSPNECCLVTGSKSMQNSSIWCPNELVKPNGKGTWLTLVANLTSEGMKLWKGQLLGWKDSEDHDFTLELVPEHSSWTNSPVRGTRLQKTVFIIDKDGKAYKTRQEQTGTDSTDNTTHQEEGPGQEEIGWLTAWGKDVQDGLHVGKDPAEAATPSSVLQTGPHLWEGSL
ncbi:hypothetical protein DFJ77DRAFT_442027 [Powellomyces hirtus]|nr:hypothetical protein DFJ77DRAFT_442027 [Powellomyces hirtus]